jgi:hypothetical protein
VPTDASLAASLTTVTFWMQRPATAKQLLTCKDTAERADSQWIQAQPNVRPKIDAASLF